MLPVIFNTLKFNIMAYEKVYIGKGTQVPNLKIVKVTLKMEEVEKIAYFRDGVQYVTFEVAMLREPDKFGRAYTCYYSKRVDEKTEPAPKRKSSKRKATADENLPF